MKIRKLLELYKELRRLRKKVRTLEDDLAYIKSKYNTLYKDYDVLFRNKAQDVQDVQSAHYDRLSFMIPQRCAYNSPYAPVPEQKWVYDKINAQMKVKFFDDLFEQGYIKCTRYDDISEVYEIQAIKQNNC